MKGGMLLLNYIVLASLQLDINTHRRTTYYFTVSGLMLASPIPLWDTDTWMVLG